MVDFKELEALLRDVVGGKRLSASKMAKLQEMCMKSLKHDTKLVSILYRTHKSLKEPNQKVSSLYVFESLARAAKHSANKHSLPIKEISSDKPGNAGTFLFKLEGILDGLVDDMIAVDTPEATEKTRKVLEIWTKANTFPADVLSRLLQSVDKGGKGTDGDATSTTPTEAPASQGSDDASVLNSLPPAILALLGNAISAEGSTAQPPPPPIPAPPVLAPPVATGLEPAQLALLQQLTQQVQKTAPPVSLVSTNFFPTQPLGGPPLPGADLSYTTGPTYIPPQNNSVRRPPEEREDPRRPGHTRDRQDSSSGTYNSGRTPRDRYDRPYDDGSGDNRRFRRPGVPDREPGIRRDRPRSRSRSPPARIEKRINSPPIRTQPIPTFTSEPAVTKPTIPTMPIPTIQSVEPAPIIRNAPLNTVPLTGGMGLQSFDFTAFDMTSAASWMRLGVAFKATYGRDGTQEELVSTYMAMQNGLSAPPVVNSGPPNMMAPNMMASNTWQGGFQQPSQLQQQAAYMPSHKINTWETREQDEMRRGRQPGHGSYDDGIGYAVQPGRWQHSDAVVLTGGEDV